VELTFWGIYIWSFCHNFGWFLVAAFFGQFMFPILVLNPRIRSDRRAERHNAFLFIFFHTWHQEHNLCIWYFLAPTDHYNIALTNVAAHLDFIENIEDLTNNPPVSDDE